uniref:Transmembrane protein n=1 Tax=Taenia asiatica TaxID=60517 RepID=A0A0R3W6I0_TAEAS
MFFFHLISCETARSLNETSFRHRNTGSPLCHTLTTRRCYFLIGKPFTLPTYTIKSTNCAVAHTRTRIHMAATPSHCPIFSAIRSFLSLFLLNPCLCVCALHRPFLVIVVVMMILSGRGEKRESSAAFSLTRPSLPSSLRCCLRHLHTAAATTTIDVSAFFSLPLTQFHCKMSCSKENYVRSSFFW